MKKVIFKNMFVSIFMISILCVSFFGVTWAWSSDFLNSNNFNDDNLAISVNYVNGSMLNLRCDISSQNKSFVVTNVSKNTEFFNVKLLVDNVSSDEIGKYLYYELSGENNVVLTYGSFADIEISNELILLSHKEILANESYEFVLKVWSENCDLSGTISSHLIVN